MALQRALRCDDDTWQRAKARAEAEHRNMQTVIVTALRAYAAGEPVVAFNQVPTAVQDKRARVGG